MYIFFFFFVGNYKFYKQWQVLTDSRIFLEPNLIKIVSVAFDICCIEMSPRTPSVCKGNDFCNKVIKYFVQDSNLIGHCGVVLCCRIIVIQI